MGWFAGSPKSYGVVRNSYRFHLLGFPSPPKQKDQRIRPYEFAGFRLSTVCVQGSDGFLSDVDWLDRDSRGGMRRSPFRAASGRIPPGLLGFFCAMVSLRNLDP